MEITIVFGKELASSVFEALEALTNLKIMEPGEENGIPVSIPVSISAEDMLNKEITKLVQEYTFDLLNRAGQSRESEERKQARQANRALAERVTIKPKGGNE